ISVTQFERTKGSQVFICGPFALALCCAPESYQENVMEKRRLGKSDLMIAPLLLGGNVFGWTADEKAIFAVLDAFVDAGLNAIDTADVYSGGVPGPKGGEAETVWANWRAARKNRG